MFDQSLLRFSELNSLKNGQLNYFYVCLYVSRFLLYSYSFFGRIISVRDENFFLFPNIFTDEERIVAKEDQSCTYLSLILISYKYTKLFCNVIRVYNCDIIFHSVSSSLKAVNLIKDFSVLIYSLLKQYILTDDFLLEDLKIYLKENKKN